MLRRRTAALLCLTTAAASLPWASLALSAPAASAATDATPGYSVRSLSVDVMTGPDRDIPCTIVADLYTPDGAARAHRVPSILQTNGFGGAKDDAGSVGTAVGFVQEGYAVLSYSGLGFGGSGCKISLDNPDYDGVAGSQMVSVLAGTKTFTWDDTGETGRIDFVARDGRKDPRVGMIGGSYGGEIQFAIAMQDPRVDAIIPEITWNDLAYSLAPNNTSSTTGVSYSTPGVHKKIWTSAFFGLGVADGVSGADNDPTRDVGCPNFLDEVCVAKAQMEALGYPDESTLDIARNSSVATYLDKITVPTLLVQGEQDTLFNLREAIATYQGLRKNGVPTTMIWRSFGHSNGTPAPGEYADTVPGASIRDTYLGRRYLAWMDHYVRGDESVRTGPGFSFFRNWVSYDTSAAHAGRAVAKAYGNRTVFRNRTTAELVLAGRDLVGQQLGPFYAGISATTFQSIAGVPTSYSETSAAEGSVVNNPVYDAPGTFASFTTAPLKKPATLVGSPTLTVQLDAPLAQQTQAGGPAGQLVLFAKLYDVAPDGTQTLQYRLVSPVRVTDVTKPVTISLPAVVQRFPAGHQIRLVLAAGDFAYAQNDTDQVISVVSTEAAPSVLRLPLAGKLEF